MFVWDESKRRKVIKSHGVDFSLLFDVFEDAFAVDFIDHEHSNETEMRYGIIGQTSHYGLILLIYSIVANNDVRFITARKAERWMMRKYEEKRTRL